MFLVFGLDPPPSLNGMHWWIELDTGSQSLGGSEEWHDRVCHFAQSLKNPVNIIIEKSSEDYIEDLKLFSDIKAEGQTIGRRENYPKEKFLARGIFFLTLFF